MIKISVAVRLYDVLPDFKWKSIFFFRSHAKSEKNIFRRQFNHYRMNICNQKCHSDENVLRSVICIQTMRDRILDVCIVTRSTCSILWHFHSGHFPSARNSRHSHHWTMAQNTKKKNIFRKNCRNCYSVLGSSARTMLAAVVERR